MYVQWLVKAREVIQDQQIGISASEAPIERSRATSRDQEMRYAAEMERERATTETPKALLAEGENEHNREPQMCKKEAEDDRGLVDRPSDCSNKDKET
ncbi:hypothetical protein LTR41_012246, partial [Exophiala xenobiotica]